MPLRLAGSCRCRAVTFSVDSHTPYPYQLCYCSICRKTAGGGGYAINLMGHHATLSVEGRSSIGVYRAEIVEKDEACRTSTGQRHHCRTCGSALWLWDEQWPDLVHPFASAIDSDLPVAAERTHLMLRYKQSWVTADVRSGDLTFQLYPTESIEAWHKRQGLWIA